MTVSIWYTRYKREGHYDPRKRLGEKTKINREEFIKYIETNPNMRAKDIGKRLEYPLQEHFTNSRSINLAIKKALTYVEANEEKHKY